MYELILTVMVTVGQPVLTLDGHGVTMITKKYEVAVTGFNTKADCTSFTGYADLTASLTSTFGSTTEVQPEAQPRCRPQPAN